MANRVTAKWIDYGLHKAAKSARTIIEGVVLLDGVRVMKPE